MQDKSNKEVSENYQEQAAQAELMTDQNSSSAVFPVQQVAATQSRSKLTPLLKATLVGFGILAIVSVLGFIVPSYDFINMSAGIVFYGGLALSVMLGISMTQLVVGENKTNKNAYTTMGVILLASSTLLVVTILPGIIFLIVGMKKDSTEAKPLSPAVKFLLGLVTFLTTGAAGLFIVIIATFSLSLRACEFTSSKCY